MRRCVLIVVVLGLIAVLLNACNSGSVNTVTVYTHSTNSAQPHVILKKGQSLQITNRYCQLGTRSEQCVKIAE